MLAGSSFFLRNLIGQNDLAVGGNSKMADGAKTQQSFETVKENRP